MQSIIIKDFFLYLPLYAVRRIEQFLIFSITSQQVLYEFGSALKQRVVNRMFWGRSLLYKNFLHGVMLAGTILILIGGITSRFAVINADGIFNQNNNLIGSDDLLQQGGSIETVLTLDPKFLGLNLKPHEVEEGETLQTIAEENNVSMDTIRWANSGLISPFSNDVNAGWTLNIPEINGVLYEVKPGQGMGDVIRLTGGNEFDIAQFNNLTQPYSLNPGDRLFIPDGNLYRPDIAGDIDIPVGVFSNPLTHSDCGGYKFSRGYLYYHNGVDLARWPGCPISAVANGYVSYAGWENGGQGYMVSIDHGGGIVTHYYHGSGTYWVKKGDRVNQGDPIMMMGSTGNSTGTHLHFSLFKNGASINPAPFVPY